jgi:hypothetical protein
MVLSAKCLIYFFLTVFVSMNRLKAITKILYNILEQSALSHGSIKETSRYMDDLLKTKIVYLKQGIRLAVVILSDISKTLIMPVLIL